MRDDRHLSKQIAHPTVPLQAVLDQQVERICQRLAGVVAAQRFLLCGGTALGTYLGHRRSNDLDFFTSQPFASDLLHQELQRSGLGAQVLKSGIDANHITMDIEGAKVEFVHWRELVTEHQQMVIGCPFAVPDLHQLARMKTRAAAGRGKRRDIVDLYFLLDRGFLADDLVLDAADHVPAVAHRFAKAIAGFRHRPGYDHEAPIHLLRNVDFLVMEEAVSRAFSAVVVPAA